jgi:hypothetical protein
MANFVALYDACVLYPAPLRDLLMRLALSGLYRARWTARIHEEWIHAVQLRRPSVPLDKLERVRELMNANIEDCVVTDYEGLESGLQLPDPNDRHVLAAAIKCDAGTIVTCNLKDFPDDVLAPYGITAQHPDEFIEHAFGINSAAVIAAVRAHRASLSRPAMTVEELLEVYMNQGLVTTVALLQPHADYL